VRSDVAAVGKYCVCSTTAMRAIISNADVTLKGDMFVPVAVVWGEVVEAAWEDMSAFWLETSISRADTLMGCRTADEEDTI
jgi:hypothetical protein